MTTAIGVVMTEHIVAGRLEDQRMSGNLLRYPEATDELDALSSLPGSELVDKLAESIATLADNGSGPCRCHWRGRSRNYSSGCC